MRRADIEGPKACVTLSTCQGSVSPRKQGENGVLNRGEVETGGQVPTACSPLTNSTRVAPGVWPP